MIYTADNVFIPCLCFDSDGNEVKEVTIIDTDTNTITAADLPVRVENHEIVVYQMKFDSVDIEYHPTLVCPHNLERLPMRFTFHGLRRIEA